MAERKLTPAMRTALILKIQKNAAQNPEYKKHVEQKIHESQKYLTVAHQKNEEALAKEIEESKRSPIDFEKALNQLKQNSK